ncbi:MAG: DNA replication/repair protein RecF [Spirochaetales bacterium]|nr:DNA replication/repair protein RecF [Spirochaetales bacterium]
MGFSTLSVYQFRNLVSDTFSFSSKEIFLIGENGQGKTNCLEALYLLCYGSSFRTRIDSLLIQSGANEASVAGQYSSDEGMAHEISVILKNPGLKEIRMNGKRVADRKEILLSIPCVVFSHDDLEFVSGSPAKKRGFFNQTLCMYDLHYLELLRNYKRVLFQRNSSLKQRSLDMLPVYNSQLVEWGFEIQTKRSNLMGIFNSIVKRYFRDIARLPCDIEIKYRPSWRGCTTRQACLEWLRGREAEDCAFRTTTSGPHRDQFVYMYGNDDFCQKASTGQLRLLSIILRVAQAGFFTDNTGKKPVLLLDDVLLELDAGRRELFVKSLPAYDQAFFTFLPDEDFGRYRKETTAFRRVGEGKIRGWNEPEIF